MEVWYDCKKVIGLVYKLFQKHSEHPSSKGVGQIEEELLCDILHFFIERWISLGEPDVPETLGCEDLGWCYDFYADWRRIIIMPVTELRCVIMQSHTAV